MLNSILGEKLSIVTKKPQTTRRRILGIFDEKDHQIIFIDTPGILEPNYLLHEKMVAYINNSISDADILLLVIDGKEDKYGDKLLNHPIVKLFSNFNNRKRFLILNKIDMLNQNEVSEILSNLVSSGLFDSVIPVSAKENFNIERVLQELREILPEHPRYFPEGQFTDETERFYVSEIIREKILELYDDEIPFSSDVKIEEFKERDSNKDYIAAIIFVERNSQKPIIIGKQGQKIKQLGQYSRAAIEEFLKREVYLELFVKVKEKWRRDENYLNKSGYNQN